MFHWKSLTGKWAFMVVLISVFSLSAAAAVNVPEQAEPRGTQQNEAQMGASAPDSANPIPGLLSYFQGSVSIGNEPLHASLASSVVLRSGQVLSTANGKAELLLTPGVYFRLGNNSAVKMVSPELTWTAVDLERGKAIVEVDQIYQENNIQIYHAGVGTQLLKTGLYEFDAADSTIKVFEGEAAVRKPGDRWVVVKGDRQYRLNAELGEKPVKFDREEAQGDLYQWSGLRSQYLAEEARKAAPRYGYYGYPAWGFSPGWYGWGAPGWYGAWGSPYWSMWRPYGWGWGWPGYYGYRGGVFIPYYGGHRR